LKRKKNKLNDTHWSKIKLLSLIAHVLHMAIDRDQY